MIKCPNCTGEMKYDTKLGKVKCEFCGSTFTVEELKEKVQDKIQMSSSDTYEGKSYKCTQCGATLLTFDDTAITFCSYCGSQAMLEDKMVKHNNPDLVIPFKKTKGECIKAYKDKISKFLFAPSYMKSDMIVDKFRGIYMPYGIYNLYKDGRVNNRGSKYAYRRGDYVYYNDYDIEADVNASYEGVSFDLVSKFYDNFSTSIPFNYKEAVEFNPSYLVGYYADSFDVNESTYNDEARSIAEYDANKRLRKVKEYWKYGCSKPTVLLKSKSKIGMFPVYFLSMKNTKDNTINYAVVNGQTGKVAADLPISFGKYILGSLLLALIVFFIIDSSFVLTPTKVSFFSIIAGIVSLIISNKQLNGIKKKEIHADDKGMKFISKEENKEKGDTVKKDTKNKKGKIRFLYKEILAIIVPILPLIMLAVDDEYYYIASIISLLLIILSFSDLVKEHNMLVSNKLPQLEERGGDENA